jgi:hypothetical protein
MQVEIQHCVTNSCVLIFFIITPFSRTKQSLLLSNEQIPGVKREVGSMKSFAFLLILLSVFSAAAFADMPARCDAVEVRIMSDAGGEYPRYRAYPRACRPGEYYYMEAVRGERYSIKVTNRSARRVGVVIAVDGRNIISGQKSDLKNSERMYIIEPWATNTFEGWRTGMDRTNRFYFTNESDSYAQRVFADGSAMGTIALSAYYEKVREPAPVTPSYDRKYRSHGSGEKSSSKRSEGEACEDQAGTGFGETTWSPAREVYFEPENSVAGRIVLKYEWRAELCRRGIVNCDCEPANRFWPVSDGFAPVPRDFNE